MLTQFLGIFLNLLTFFFIFDHLQPVVEAAVFSVLESLFNDGLTENKLYKRSFQMLIVELPKALEDACDTEVIVHGVVEMTKSTLPVFSSFQFTYNVHTTRVDKLTMKSSSTKPHVHIQ